MKMCLALMAHACNPRYPGGRDQEDSHSSHPRQTVHEILSIKYLTLKGLMQWLKV
jgi:hypothetical protein